MVDLPEPVQADSSSYPGITNELSDYISRNNFDALIGRALKHSPKRLFSVWMSGLTCPCTLLESSRVGA